MIEVSYFCYLLISIAMTVWVARTLSSNGLVFLVDSFNSNEALAKSVNHMLVVGFYLINLGYILLALKSSKNIETMRQAIEILSWKIGVVLVVLGALHFMNMLVIAKWRNRAMHNRQLEKVM